MRLMFWPALLALVLSFGAAAQPAGVNVPPRQVAPNDEARYGRLVLPNGMKVLLLSDPKLNVSSVAVTVGVGSMSDPPQRQGLAHFLEHMLFLGSAKYPDITGFDAYLRRNSGAHNAYTAADRTNYHLEIRHEAFEGALDRLAQFFVAPLFDPRFTEREVNAVASEHQKNLENDLWRENQLSRVAYAPGHPARHFGTGSKQTLAGVTREELLDFYQRHYSANRMALAIASPAGLDQQERWARQYFAAVPDRGLAPVSFPPDYLPRKAALRMLRMEPIKDLRSLNLEFPLPPVRDGWWHKSAELLGFVFGSESPGTLLSQLKAEGLATTLAAGVQSPVPQLASLELQIGLTPEGLNRVPRVLELVFATARLLREQGLPPHLFAERRALAELDERYRDKGEGASLAAALANLALDHPLELAERVPFLWLKEDPAAFRALADRLTPDNLLVTLVAKGQAVDRTEPIYGTRYSYTEDPGPAYTALLNPPPVAGLHLPRPNPYVPARTALTPLQPARLIDEPALSLFHAQDTEFQRPQAALFFRHRLPRELGTPRHAVLLQLYEACVREVLNETTYQAAEAGLRFVLSAAFEGVTLAVEGWDESAGRLLDAVLPELTDCRLSPQRFADQKDRLVRGLSAFETADAYISVRESRRQLVREFYATPAQMLPLAREATLAEVQAFARTLFARGKLEALAYGNVVPADAVAAARRVAGVLRTQPLPPEALLRPRQLVMQPGESLRTTERLKVNNSTLRREYQLGDAGPEARAAAAVVSALVGDRYYSELRTRQQLGYIVQGNAFEDERQTVALFIIQSGDHPAHELEARNDAFLATLPEAIRTMPPEAFAAAVAGVRARLLERDKSVAERAQRLFVLAYERGGDWQRNADTLKALDTLTAARAADWLARAIDPATRRMRTFLGFARQHEPPAGLPPSITDLEAFKRGRQYQ